MNFIDPYGEWIIPAIIVAIVVDVAADVIATHDKTTTVDTEGNATITDTCTITPPLIPIRIDYETSASSTGETHGNVTISVPGGSYNIGY